MSLAGLSKLECAESGSLRIAAPLTRPTKLICVGPNYVRHFAEPNAQTPAEPIIFMNSSDSFINPNDNVIIPPGSTSTVYEVELAVVIGKRALYLKSPNVSSKYLQGCRLSQDINERPWQIERSGH